jgi:ribosomal protein L35
MAEKENQAAKPRFKLTNSGGVMPVFDSLSNVVTGMGTNRDRRSYNRFAPLPSSMIIWKWKPLISITG